MTIQVGDRLPSSSFYVMTPDGPAPKSVEEVFSGRTVMLFAVPGAFTPTCHRNHLPGYVAQAKAFKDKGVDAIAVTGVNDVFVFDAWAKASGGAGVIEFLSDGNGDFAKGVGLDLDGSAHGLGRRSQRYAMLVENGVVRHLAVEASPATADVSGATAMLAALDPKA